MIPLVPNALLRSADGSKKVTDPTSISQISLAADGLPPTGFVRLSRLLAPNGPLPISKSCWWEGVRNQRYPQPVKLGPRITAWRCEDIRILLQKGVA